MMATTSLKLPEHLKEKIAKLAQGVAQTPHAYMVEAIAARVLRDEKRREFLRAADESMAEVESGGPVYSHAAVSRYILALARGERPRKPRPIRGRSAKR
jgi:predicted transcriptional regulator